MMLKPSYAELMDVMNKEKDADVTSRYTVVIAAAKRARQLIDGDEPMIEDFVEGKPVTTAVNEIYDGKIAVVPQGQGTKIKVKKKKEKLELEEEIQQAKPSSVNDKRTAAAAAAAKAAKEAAEKEEQEAEDAAGEMDNIDDIDEINEIDDAEDIGFGAVTEYNAEEAAEAGSAEEETE